MTHERNEGDQIAERLQMLLDAVIEAVVKRSVVEGEDAIASDELLARPGPVQSAFVDFQQALRDGAGFDLAVVEWVAKPGDPPFVSIHNGGKPADQWPLWRRIV